MATLPGRLRVHKLRGSQSWDELPRAFCHQVRLLQWSVFSTNACRTKSRSCQVGTSLMVSTFKFVISRNFTSDIELVVRVIEALWFGGEHWEHWEPYGNLQNPTQMLSYNQMNNQPFHLANLDFSSAEISSIGFCDYLFIYFSGCLRSSWTIGWGVVNEWLGCGLPTKAQPPFTAPQWHGLVIMCSRMKVDGFL